MDFSAGWLMTSFLVSTVGLGFFLYGKKQTRIPQLACGILLMGHPYVVSSPLWMLGITSALLAGLWLALRVGL